MNALNDYELKYWSLNKKVIGIDEAGRGPLAGPLVVAGVILPLGYELEGLDDSKKLTEKQRLDLFSTIVKDAIEYWIEIVPVEEIDEYDIYHATKRTMIKIAEESNSDMVLVDAMPLEISKPHLSIIKGDHLSISIAAASILAKVTRDQIMYGYDKLFPQYDFAKHKGYPTKRHMLLMEQNGLLEIYRKSYAPVKKLLG